MKDYYKILGINERSTSEEITAGYQAALKELEETLTGGDFEREAEELKNEYELILVINRDIRKMPDYTYFGEQVDLRPQLLSYNELRSVVQERIAEFTGQYIKNYNSYNSLDKFLELDASFVEEKIRVIIELCINKAIKMNYDVYDADTFLSTYGPEILKGYLVMFEELQDASDQIDQAHAINDGYRKLKHDLNYNKGVLSHVGNLSKKVSNANETKKLKKEVYENQDIKQGLTEVFKIALLNVVEVSCELLNYPGENQALDIAMSDSIYNNMNKYEEDIQIQKLVKAISLNPYNKLLYWCALENFGDCDLKLDDISKLFGMEIKSIKLSLLKKYKYNNENYQEQNYTLAKEEIIEAAQFYGIKADEEIYEIDQKIEEEKYQTVLQKYENSDTSTEDKLKIVKSEVITLAEELEVDIATILEEIDGKLEEFDIQARTIMGIKRICDTREEASEINEKYGDNLVKLVEIKEKVDGTLTNAINSLEEIEKLNLPEEYSGEILEKLRNDKELLMKEYKNVANTSFMKVAYKSLTFLAYSIVSFVIAQRMYGGWQTLIKWGLYLIAIVFLIKSILIVKDKRDKSKEFESLQEIGKID